MSVLGTAAWSRRGCRAQGSHPAHKKCPYAGWWPLRQNNFSLLGKLVKTESVNSSKSRWDRDGLGYKTAKLCSKEDGPTSLEAAQGTRLGLEQCGVNAKQSSVSSWGMTHTELQFYSQRGAGSVPFQAISCSSLIKSPIISCNQTHLCSLQSQKSIRLCALNTFNWAWSIR